MYRIGTNPFHSAVGAMQGATGAASSMTKKQTQEIKGPKKTFGGALAASLGGSMAGMQLAEQFNPGTQQALWNAGIDLFTGGSELGVGSTMAQGIGMNAATQAASTFGSSIAPAMASASAMAPTAATGGAAIGTGTTAVGGMIPGGAAMAQGIGMNTAVNAASTYGASIIPSMAAAPTTASLTGVAGAGTASGVTTGITTGSTAGPIGAGIGATVGLLAGLASYYL